METFLPLFVLVLVPFIVFLFVKYGNITGAGNSLHNH